MEVGDYAGDGLKLGFRQEGGSEGKGAVSPGSRNRHNRRKKQQRALSITMGVDCLCLYARRTRAGVFRYWSTRDPVGFPPQQLAYS